MASTTRALRWLSGACLLVVILLVGVGEVLVHRAGPIVRGRVVETLQARFRSRVELDDLDVSLLQGLEVSGGGLRIFAPDDMVAAGVTRPLIAIRQFTFHVGLRALVARPMHVGTVRVSGLEIHVPPRQMRSQRASNAPERSMGKIEIVVDEFLFADSRLVIDTADAGKQPKVFELQRIQLQSVGQGVPLRYDATLVNAVPRGDIHATGDFGPWQAEMPGDSPVDGHYTFDRADLDPIKGIGGTLSSVGDFRGRLNRIDVTGTADVPNFSLDTARQPMPLKTRFHAVVDGTTGDTYLDPVEARLRNSSFTCRGSIVNMRGKGHVIDMDVEVPNGNLQDFLALAVKTRPVLMTAQITTRAKLHIHPGKEPVMQKLTLNARFTLRQVHFLNPAFQDKVDELSLRGQGRPAEAKAGAPAVSAEMTGQVAMSGGRLNFENLEFTVPGAEILAEGVYSLDGEQFDIHGKARTRAKASEMVQSWWKQLLLKPVDRYLSRNGAGMEVPFKVSGTKGAPKFGFDFEQFKKDRSAHGVATAK